MTTDLAIDYNTGDLIFAPNKDLEVRVGQSTVDQRIRVRLRIIQGEWELDPTGGSLGSRLVDALRMPVYRAEQEIPLIVREALDPMEDIIVSDVTCQVSDDDSRAVQIAINYSIVDDGTESEETQTANLTLVG